MLISESYRAQQQTLHEQQAGAYGTLGRAYAPLVAQVINKLGVTHLLDYGCGRNLSLPKEMADQQMVKHKFTYQAYDPAVPEYAALPVPAEMVVSIDVLEHVEPECVEAVLDHLYELTEAVGFFAIDTGPALKTLPDGRNVHLTQRPPEWWLPQIMARFDLQTYQVTYRSETDEDHMKFYVLVHARKRSIEGTDGSKMS